VADRSNDRTSSDVGTGDSFVDRSVDGPSADAFDSFAADDRPADSNGSSCLIGGTTHPSGQVNAQNGCQICDPGRAPTDWSNRDNLACDDGDACTEGDTCTAGSCEGAPIMDSFEPNDSAFGARGGVGDVNSCSTLNNRSLEATLFPTTDDDWYSFTSNNIPACAWHPTIKLVGPVAVDFDLYVYFKCKNGSVAAVTCGMGSTKVFGFDGASVGCASTNRGSTVETVELTPSCSLASDITIYVNVAHFGGRTCSPYTLSWGDN
jgi:hypothetical protein